MCGKEHFVTSTWPHGAVSIGSICFVELSLWLGTQRATIGKCQEDFAFFCLATHEF